MYLIILNFNTETLLTRSFHWQKSQTKDLAFLIDE